MEKATNEKTLRIYSNLMLVLAGLDIVNLLGGWLSGDFNSAALAELYSTSKSLTITIIVVILGIAALVILAKLYMGIKGLRAAKGISSGTGHITVGKIALVCCVILFVISLLNLIFNISGASVMDWLDMLSPLASCLIAGSYLKSAKAVG